MKNILKYSLYGFALMGFLFSTSSKAQAETEFDPFISIYTVANGFGDTIPEESFTLGETPYLFVEFDQSLDPDFIHTEYFPEIGGTPLGGASPIDPGASTQQWWSLDDWGINQSEGIWAITVALEEEETAGHSAYTNFTVTPEPISTALFLIGGAPIALSLYRRRKFRV